MTIKPLKNFNTKLQFLYRKNEFLNPKLRRLSCNSLIQPHFDKACIFWFPSLAKEKERK